MRMLWCCFDAGADSYSKTLGTLSQYYKNEPNSILTDSESFKSQAKIRKNTPNDGNAKDVEIAVSLKYLSKFWRTLEMPPINYKINSVLTWSLTCVITIQLVQEYFQ